MVVGTFVTIPFAKCCVGADIVITCIAVGSVEIKGYCAAVFNDIEVPHAATLVFVAVVFDDLNTIVIYEIIFV